MYEVITGKINVSSLRVKSKEKMVLLTLLLGILTCKVTADLDEDSCNQTSGDHARDSNYDNLEYLFINDNDTQFNEETARVLEDDTLNMDVMTSMFNSIVDGETPEYIADNGYELIANQSGKYNYSDGNMGTHKGFIYGHLQKAGKEDIHSSLYFTVVEGKKQVLSYNTGSCIYSRVHYIQKDIGVEWRAFTSGILLLKLPFGAHFIHGGYAGITRGGASIVLGPELHFATKTLGVTESLLYRSKTVTDLIGSSTLSNYTLSFDMQSLTDGTNATMSCYSRFIPQEQETVSSWNGTLSNLDRIVEVQIESMGYTRYDGNSLLADANLQNLFSTMFLAIGLHLQ